VVAGPEGIACRNPALAADRGRKREDLLQATEKLLAPIAVRRSVFRTPGFVVILRGCHHFPVRLRQGCDELRFGLSPPIRIPAGSWSERILGTDLLTADANDAECNLTSSAVYSRYEQGCPATTE
jgi:hypothetical protein